MRTEQSSSHCANLIVALPHETFPLGESSKSPLHFAAHRDESVIVGYYTSGEVHLRPRHLPLNPERRDALWQEMMVLTAPVSETLPFRTRLLATLSSTMSVKRTAIGTPILSPEPRYYPPARCMERPLQEANRQLHRPVLPTGIRWNHLHARPETGCHPLL